MRARVSVRPEIAVEFWGLSPFERNRHVHAARFACRVTLAALFLEACVIPVAPEFEPPEGNLSPYIVSAEPRELSIVDEDQEISVIVADPNLGDQLYYRWVFNYPKFTTDSRLTIQGTIPAAVGGSPVRSGTILRIRPDCFRDLVPGYGEQRAMLIVSDRPFVELPDDAQHPYDQVPPGGFIVRATWVVRKECLVQ